MAKYLNSSSGRVGRLGLASVAFLVAFLVVAPCAKVAAQASAPNRPKTQHKIEAFVPSAERPDAAMVELGRALFFDPRLSGDATLSCATCHDPNKSFTDGLEMSKGYPGALYFRNTPTLLNASHRHSFYWDGRMSGDDLPSLVRDHISEAHFMQADGRLVIERMRQIPEYVEQFEKAAGGEPTYGRILNSVAAFVATLETTRAPIDDYLGGDADALNPAAKRGLKLFTGKANCIACHHGSLLTDEAFHNLGVSPNPLVFEQPERHVTFRRFMRTIGVGQCATLAQDIGLQCVTKQTNDLGRFRTPSLREVAKTAPYMHNGTLGSLEAVVDFYDQGGGKLENGQPRLKRLGLTADEKRDLISFLQSLSSPQPQIDPVEPPAYQATPFEAQEIASAEPNANADSKPIDNAKFPRLAKLPVLPVPPDNKITEAKSELGRLLFFDDRLSGDIGTSCASCHDPRLGWGDGNGLSRGYAGTQHWRNSQTTVNTGYLTKLFWAGEVTSLEAQAKSAITGNLAGNGDTAMIEERLAQVPEYVKRFKDVFGGDRPLFDHVLKAIATFERAEMNAADSPFDEYLEGDESALTDAALRGKTLFEGKANCIRCHNGGLMSDENYHALGVPENDLFQEDPLRQVALRYQHFIRGVPEPIYRGAHTDMGLYYTTKRSSDAGKFRTPPLRYIDYTAPYMHNGAFETLEDVIDFYDEGGGTAANKSSLLQPLNLTEDEKFDLLEFLEHLSGDEIRMRPPELPPYAAISTDRVDDSAEKRSAKSPLGTKTDTARVQ